jgi:Monooxygenase af470-like
MAKIAGRRMTAEVDGDFVVFLIGARPNTLRLLDVFRDLGGRRGMKHMLDYLMAHPDKGLLAYEMGFPTIVQYWRSFEHLEAFAKNTDDPHLEAIQ